MARIAVIGGHGKVALRLSPLLQAAGHEVTAWVRNPDHVSEVEESGATAQHRGSFRRALPSAVSGQVHRRALLGDDLPVLRDSTATAS